MEKFALLDFLKVFQSLAANTKTEKEPATPPPTQENPQQQPPSPQPATYERNVMADVITHHEEVANRIRNKRSD